MLLRLRRHDLNKTDFWWGCDSPTGLFKNKRTLSVPDKGIYPPTLTRSSSALSVPMFSSYSAWVPFA